MFNKNEERERLDLETKIKNSLEPDSNHHNIKSQDFSGTGIPDWGGNIYGSSEIRSTTNADKTKETAKEEF